MAVVPAAAVAAAALPGEQWGLTMLVAPLASNRLVVPDPGPCFVGCSSNGCHGLGKEEEEEVEEAKMVRLHSHRRSSHCRQELPKPAPRICSLHSTASLIRPLRLEMHCWFH